MENETMSSSLMNTKRKGLSVTSIIGILILIVLIVGAIYSSKNMSPEKKQAMENDKLMQSLGRIVLIPNEQPIIATINQADVLVKEQAFYNGSQNGDKLVIFPKAQKAIIYSPSRNIVVNSGPFVVNSGTANTQTPTAPTTKK